MFGLFGAIIGSVAKERPTLSEFIGKYKFPNFYSQTSQEKFIELPGAYGAFTDEEELKFDQALKTLKEFLEDKSKVYLLGFRKDKSFIQIDRTEAGADPSLLMIETKKVSVFEQMEKVKPEDAIAAFEAYWRIIDNHLSS